MPLETPELHTSLQRLLVGLIVILVPLTVFGFYVALQGDTHIRQVNGENFRSLTLTTAESTLALGERQHARFVRLPEA